MKIKHNKKRNTAFLFEALIRELTKTVVSGDSKRGTVIKGILREHFGRGMVLFSELDCFNSITDLKGVDQYTAEKTIHRARVGLVVVAVSKTLFVEAVGAQEHCPAPCFTSYLGPTSHLDGVV